MEASEHHNDKTNDANDEENVVPFKAKRKTGNRSGLTGEAITGLNLEEAGSAEVIPIESIQVDPEYQRDLRWDLVNQIAQGYDIVKAGPILVSERPDGSLWAVDGQHRMAGAEQAGEAEIFAHVVHGLTKEQEAELRLARNNRKSDTQQEKFKTRLVMGDPVAHAIMAIVANHGTKVNLSPSSYGGINAIATLETIYNIDGTGVWLTRMLTFLRDIVGEDSEIDSTVANTALMKAVTWFIGQHIDTREVSRSEVIDRFRTVDVDDIRRKAISHKAALGGSMWVNTYRAMVEIWNYRRQEHRQIKWKTIGSMSRLGSESSNPQQAAESLRRLRENYSGDK